MVVVEFTLQPEGMGVVNCGETGTVARGCLHTDLLPSARRICTEVTGCPGSTTTDVEGGGGCGAALVTSGVRLQTGKGCAHIPVSKNTHSLA